jgi:hypothetical protein
VLHQAWKDKNILDTNSKEVVTRSQVLIIRYYRHLLVIVTAKIKRDAVFRRAFVL